MPYSSSIKVQILTSHDLYMVIALIIRSREYSVFQFMPPTHAVEELKQMGGWLVVDSRDIDGVDIPSLKAKTGADKIIIVGELQERAFFEAICDLYLQFGMKVEVAINQIHALCFPSELVVT